MAGDASLHQWLYYCQFIITWYSISGFSQNLLPATCSLHQFYTLLVLRSCVQGDRERLHFNFLWAPSPCTFFPKQDSWLVRNNVELFLECWALVIYFIPGGDPRVLGICRGKTALCKSVIPTISTVRGSELWSFSGYLNLPITTWECWGKATSACSSKWIEKAVPTFTYSCSPGSRPWFSFENSAPARDQRVLLCLLLTVE